MLLQCPIIICLIRIKLCPSNFDIMDAVMLEVLVAFWESIWKFGKHVTSVIYVGKSSISVGKIDAVIALFIIISKIQNKCCFFLSGKLTDKLTGSPVFMSSNNQADLPLIFAL